MPARVTTDPPVLKLLAFRWPERAISRMLVFFAVTAALSAWVVWAAGEKNPAPVRLAADSVRLVENVNGLTAEIDLDGDPPDNHWQSTFLRHLDPPTFCCFLTFIDAPTPRMQIKKIPRRATVQADILKEILYVVDTTNTETGRTPTKEPTRVHGTERDPEEWQRQIEAHQAR